MRPDVSLDSDLSLFINCSIIFNNIMIHSKFVQMLDDSWFRDDEIFMKVADA